MQSLAAQLVRQLPTTISLRTDGDLLAGFLNHGAEDDFAELVRRHGPLVWGVCRRTLPDPADAEDAFQATFLVLLRRGRKLTGYPTISPWLHKVAAWTARNVRRRNARRLARQSALPEQIPSPNLDADLPLDIDAALLALPEKFRSPIVLCHLLGYSRADAAERLGCPEGTLSSWLSRGLARLRAQFGGLDPTKPLTVAAVAVPGVLTSSVVRAAVASRVAAASTAVVSTTVSQVVEGVIRMFWIKKATAALMAACVVFALGVGVGMSGRVVEGVAEGQEKVKPLGEKGSPREVESQRSTIEKLEHEIRVAEADLHSQLTYLRKAATVIQNKEPMSKDFLSKLAAASSRTDQLAQNLAEMRQRHLSLTGANQKADQLPPKSTEPKTDLERIDKRLEDLRLRWETVEAETRRIKVDADITARRFELLALERKAIDDMVAQLVQERNKLVGKQPALTAKTASYLELVIRGTAPRYEFALREFDAQGKEIGTAVFDQSAAMLAKVLARTKADPTAPAEVRVLASPPTALGGGPQLALKACDAAGYKTVKFSGYVVAGGFAQELKIDEKGEVPGYKRYDGAERKVTELIKEIEEGMRTF